MKKPIFFFAFANDLEDRESYLRNLADEFRSIRTALRQAERAGLCKIVDRPNVTINDIFDVFQDKDYANNIALFHFGGHANSYSLLLESKEQQKSMAHSEGLVSFLGRQKGLQLIFLNGCSTEQQALDLIEAGIPSVIGTSTRINDETAKTLATRFYNGLGQGRSIFKAWLDAIDDLKTKGAKQYRDIGLEETELEPNQFPWKLHIREGAEKVKEWNLPEAVSNPLFGLPALSADYYLPEMPFRYLHRFERKHAEIFFGRGTAIRNLYEQVISSKSHPIILLYGQSGVGKSSLLEAGLFPRLENSHQIKFLRRDAEKGLVNGLKELLGAQPKEDIKTIWLREEEKNQPLCVVLDQVEEIFTQPTEKYPKELEQLCELLKDLFYFKKNGLRGKIILSYRKEFHPEINASLQKKELPRTEIFVEKLDRAGIMEAVEGLTKTTQLQNQYKLIVEPNLPAIIADDLLEDRVSAIAPVLQILLTKMWEVSHKLPGDPHFTILTYQELRKRGYLLSHFLQEKMNELEQWNEEAVKSGLALDLLAFHTTDKGTAKQRKIQQIRDRYKGRMDLIDQMIQKIKDSYLLTETENDSSTLTLAHDTLAVLVKNKFEKSELPGPKAFRILKHKIKEWLKDRSSSLLTEEEIKTLVEGKSGMRDWSLEETELFQECQTQIQKLNQQKRVKNYTIFGLLFLSLIGGFFYFKKNIENNYLTISKESDRLFNEGRKLQATNPTLALENMLAGWKMQETPTKTNLISNLYRDNLFYDSLFTLEKGNINIIAFNLTDNVFGITIKDRLPIYLYNWKTLPPILLDSLEGPKNDISSLQFSDDGRFLLAGSTDRKAHVWDWKQNTHQVFSNNEDSFAGHVNVVSMSHDGKKVAVGQEETLHIWDFISGEIINSVKLGQKITAITFDQENSGVWIGEEQGSLFFLSSNSSELKLLHSDSSSIISIHPLNDKNKMLHVTEKGIYIWNTNGNLPYLEKNITQSKRSLRFTNAICSKDGKLLLTATDDKQVRLWDIQADRLLYILAGHQQAIKNLAFNQEGDLALTASSSVLLSWKIPMNFPTYSLEEGTSSVEALSILSDGKKMVAGTKKPGIEIWDLTFQKLDLSKTTPNLADVKTIAFDRKGTSILSGDQSGNILQWPLAQGNAKTIHQLEKGVKAMDVNEEEVLMAIDDPDVIHGKINTSTITKWKGHRGNVLSVDLYPGSNNGLSGGADSLAILWNITTGKMTESFFHENGEVRSLTFFDEGESFLSIDENSNLYYWNIKTKTCNIQQLQEENIKYLIADAADRFFVTASSSKIQVWQKDGALLREYASPPGDKIRSLVLSPDGQWIYSGNRNGKIHAWKIDRLPEFLFE